MLNKNSKNVLIITKSVNSIGGVEEVVDMHCNSFLKCNCSINVLSIKNKKNKYVKTYKDIDKATINKEKGLFSFELGFKFFKKLIKYASNSSILVCHQPFSTGLIGLMILSLLKNRINFKHNKLKVFIYIHCLPSRTKIHRLIYFLLMRILLNFNKEYILLVSSYSKDNKMLLKNLKNPISKLIIPIKIPSKVKKIQIPNKDKLIVEKFIAIKKKYHNKKIAVFIGRIAFYKGLMNLIKAYNNSKDYPKLCIFGVGSYSSKIKEKIALLENKNDVYFFNDYLEESSKFFIIQNADIYYFPSITNSEAYGIAQLEALSCGVPVLNTNLGTGVNEICKNMIHGITVEKYNSINLLKDSIVQIKDLTEKGFFKKVNLENYVKDNFSYSIYENQFLNSFMLEI